MLFIVLFKKQYDVKSIRNLAGGMMIGMVIAMQPLFGGINRFFDSICLKTIDNSSINGKQPYCVALTMVSIKK
jgi:hypothetical protein